LLFAVIKKLLVANEADDVIGHVVSDVIMIDVQGGVASLDVV
jgi:hypothetical protein